MKQHEISGWLQKYYRLYEQRYSVCNHTPVAACSLSTRERRTIYVISFHRSSPCSFNTSRMLYSPDLDLTYQCYRSSPPV